MQPVDTATDTNGLLSIEEQLKWVQLSLIKGVGSQTFCQLLSAFGAPNQVFSASGQQLKAVVSEKIALAIQTDVESDIIETTRQWLAQPDNTIVTLADSAYPQSLLETADPPPLLYTKGNINLLNQTSLAMVGSRNASTQGEKNAEAFAFDLAKLGLCIVSGMALGIDGAAHRGALNANGATIAVVGTGLDIVYPSKHRDLAHKIVENGLIISEFPLSTPSIPQNFPKRNRIISGLSLGCLVVEANLRSGSQITARLAAEQGREVFAIPGSIHSPMAKGCHQLIKQGAKLVDSTQDIIEELKLNTQAPVKTKTEQKKEVVESDHPLLAVIGFEPISLENIVQQSGLPAHEVSSQLMMLELNGQVESITGGFYQQLANLS
jgi:DNA processing protein